MSDFLWSFMASQPSKIWHYLWTFSNMGSISPIINTFCASTSVLILYWSLRIFKQLLFHRDIFLLIRINQKFNILLSFWLISINTFYASTYVLILYWSLRFISHRYSYLYIYVFSDFYCFFSVFQPSYYNPEKTEVDDIYVDPPVVPATTTTTVAPGDPSIRPKNASRPTSFFAQPGTLAGNYLINYLICALRFPEYVALIPIHN